MKRLSPLMFGLLFAFGVSGAALAQDSYSQQQPPAAQGMAPETQEVQNLSEAEIEKFAEVLPKIETIRADYSQRLEGVSNVEQAEKLQNEARELMVEAVTDSGLEVETYNNIAMALQTNEELRERVQSMLN